MNTTDATKPNSALALMPYPQQLTLLEGRLTLDRHFSVHVVGLPWSTLPEPQKAHWQYSSCKRFVERLYRQTGVPMLNWQQDHAAKATLCIEIAPPNDEPASALTLTPKSLDSEEGYQLSIHGQGIALKAPSWFGVLHGMETLLQLLQVDDTGYFLPHVVIDDAPRFRWRGMSIDTARRYIPVDILKRQLDAMVAAKLNVFHWHFWDDQAIRLEFASYPKLWQRTADGESYSKAEVKTLVEYAMSLGIRVIPEISLPGHASALAHAYPELVSGTEQNTYPHQRAWGVFEPLVNPIAPALAPFLEQIFDELVALFPDRYVHIGGDEPNFTQWRENPQIQAFIATHQLDGEKGLQAYLNQQIECMLRSRGRRMIGWDEVWHDDLPRTVVIQSWQGHESLSRAAKQGFQGILSTGYYLDQAQPTSYHYRNDPLMPILPLQDNLLAGEEGWIYRWVKPRPKEAPRQGNLIIIHSTDGGYRAFTDYDGKPRQCIDILHYQPGQAFIGRLDNFMSVVEFHFQFEQGQLVDSYQLIGNVRYPTFSNDSAPMQRVAMIDAPTSPATSLAISSPSDAVIPEPSGGRLTSINQGEQQRILGGEITVWGENLDALTLESRLWPRSFAIAERLWSAQTLTDETSMYQRLQQLDRWSVISLGLRHHEDCRRILQRLAKQADCAPLVALTRYLEPAQYYARHWQKWQSTVPPGERYNQHERLNRLVDALPVESLDVYQMEQYCQQLKDGDASVIEPLAEHYLRAQQAARQAEPLFAQHVASIDAVALARATDEVAEIGARLLADIRANHKPSPEMAEQLRARLAVCAAIFDETIVALVRPTERLLHILTN